MKLTSFGDAEKFLLSRRPDINAVNWFFSLEDMRKFMRLLGNPQDNPRSVHVAGTSGKTSTCYYLSQFLSTESNNVGLSVSPNVEKISERVQINNESISDQEFFELFDRFINLSEVQSVDITYFGLIVAFAFWVFAQKKVDYSVIEVGMGGRLDATNVITNPNKISVITDIGLDHTKFLGDTLDKIAREKAGIILPNTDVFMARQADVVCDVIKDVCRNNNATLHILKNEVIEQAPQILPPFQRRNWSLAKMVYEYVAKRDGLAQLDKQKIQKTLDTKIPARMEIVKYKGKTVILDGSHNAQKINALVEGIKEKFPGQKFCTIISMVEGKDSNLNQSLRSLQEVTDNLIVTEFTIAQDIKRQPISAEKIAAIAREEGFKSVDLERDTSNALECSMKSEANFIIITGSFFLLNHIRPLVINA